MNVSRPLYLCLVFLWQSLLFSSPIHAQAISPPPYPVIFVHGLNSSESSWGDLRKELTDLSSAYQWDYGGALKVSGPEVLGTDPGDVYTMEFTDNSLLGFQEQGAELNAIIKAVLAANSTSKAILVAHSMGGLASRAYLQGLAAPLDGPIVSYGDDVAKLITVGTPHQGSSIANACDPWVAWICWVFGPNSWGPAMDQLKPGSPMLTIMNNAAADPFGSHALPPSIDFFSIIGLATTDAPFNQADGDGIVTRESQDLSEVTGNISNHDSTELRIREGLCSKLPYSQAHTCETSDKGVWSIVIDQITTPPPVGVDTVPSPFSFANIVDTPLNEYVVSEVIAVAGINTTTGISITNGEFSVNGQDYTSSPGMVYPGDWLTVRLRSSDQYSTLVSATLEIGGVPETFSVTTLSGSSFLPAPAVVSPGDGAGQQLTAPALIWSPVVGATSYRVMIAESTGNLPTDPATSTCAGCLVNAVSDHDAAFYLAPTGLLKPATTYHWTVHARHPDNYGTWSASASFTTGNDISFETVYLTASPSAGGDVDGAGQFRVGDPATVSATQNSGYIFTHWSENGSFVSSSSSYSFDVNASRFLVANFSPTTVAAYTLSASASAGGSVSAIPSLVSYEPGQNVSITAVPESGYAFSGWSGDASGMQNSLTVVMGDDKSITANFTQAVPETGSIRISVSPQAAADLGAQWRFIGETAWRGSGTIASNLPYGSYTAEFSTISGWSTPIHQSVTIGRITPDTWVDSDSYVELTAEIQPPSNLQASIPEEGQLNLTWVDNSDNEIAFKLVRREGMEGEFQHNYNLSPDTTEFLHTSFETGRTYCFRLAAVDIYGQPSGYSNTVCAMPIPAPSDPGCTAPVVMQGNSARVAGGDAYTLALKADGSTLTWGSNYAGQLGDGSTTDKSSPDLVNSLNGVLDVDTGGSHSVALRLDGAVWTWGENSSGQLGDGTTIDQLVPTTASGLSDVIDIAAGGNYTLAVKEDGQVWSWGYNQSGQLGDGTTTNRSTPVQVVGLSNVVAVSGGWLHSLALKSDGTVWAWGPNYDGRIGDGTTTNRPTAVQVSGLTDIVAISAGDFHSLALKSDGTVWAWGGNEQGVLGDGTTVERHSPGQIAGLANITSVSAGYTHSLATDSSGEVFAWGGNSTGQLGDGSGGDPATPVVKVLALQGVTHVNAGRSPHHSTIVRANGSVCTWGGNVAGQLGLGYTGGSHLYPIQSVGVGGVGKLYLLDNKPNAFAFTAQEFVGLGVPVDSSSVTVNGVNGLTDVNVIGGAYSINGGPYTDADGSVNNGDTVTVRVTSASAHYLQAVATLVIGGVSADFQVTTASDFPIADSGVADGIKIDGAVMNASIAANGPDALAYFDYGETTGYGQSTSVQGIPVSQSEISISHVLSGLDCSTTYHARVAVTNGEGTTHGSDVSFTTLDCDSDTDSDGVTDSADNCSSVSNASQLDTDSDTYGDACDFDDDEDGLSDAAEASLGSNSLLRDTDGDGLDDALELSLGSSLILRDSDGDGFSDGVEVGLGNNPLDDSDTPAPYVIPSSSSLILNGSEDDISPSWTMGFTAVSGPVTGITGCGFYDNESNPISPSIISLQSGTVPESFTMDESVALTFACDTAGPGQEQAVYSCSSDHGNFGVSVECDIQPTPSVWVPSPYLQGVLGGADPSSSALIGANEDLTNISCEFMDNLKLAPLVPARISLIAGAVPSSMTTGAFSELIFSCDAATAGSEWVEYSCASDQGPFSMPVQCTIDSLAVNPRYSFIRGVLGNLSPTKDVEFGAMHAGLTNLSCDFGTTPGRISLVSGAIPTDFPQGSTESLTFGCDSSTVGSEYSVYSCNSDQGSALANIYCSIRDRYPVEPWPEEAILIADVGAPLPSVVIDMTADGADVSNINSCGFYNDSLNQSPTTPRLISLSAGEIPSSLLANESVALTFACDNSGEDQENSPLFYGCHSDQGVFNVEVGCKIDPASVQLTSVEMSGLVGGETLETVSSLVAIEDLSNISCDFVDWTLSPVTPLRIDIATIDLPVSMASGDTLDLTFSCDTTTAGEEFVGYQCSTDQGVSIAAIYCNVNAFSLQPQSANIDGVRGNPAPSWDIELSAESVAISGLSCDFPIAPSRISHVLGSVPTGLALGESAALTFSCDTSTAGSESMRYSCSSDQGQASTSFNCDIRERYPVEPWPEQGQMTAAQGEAHPTIVVDMTAEGAEVTNVGFCGFYEFGVLPYTSVTPAKIGLQGGSVPTSFTSDQSEPLTFACDTSSSGFEKVYYGCNSNQGIFAVTVECDIGAPTPVTITPPLVMQSEVGDENPISQANVFALGDLSGILCGFEDFSTRQPTAPSLISLAAGSIPANLSSGGSVELTFSCDAKAEGREDVYYGCSSDQGTMAMLVSCVIGSSACPGNSCQFMRGWRYAIPLRVE